MEEEEGLLLSSHTEELSSSSKESYSLFSEISNASTKAFVLAFIVSSSGAFAFGCIVGYSAPTQSSIMNELNLSIADYSLFGSILTVGLIIGALICGKLTDLVGRVYTIWITNILIIIGWFAIAFAQGVWLLDLGRLLQGISVGISSYLGPVYITEIAPTNLRGAVCTLVQLFVGIGLSASYVLGTAVAWRNLAILGSIPCLMILPLLFFIPESPRWLAKVGREKEVEAVFLSLRGAKSDVSDEVAEILEYTKHVKEQQDFNVNSFFKIFQRKYALSVTIGVVLVTLPQLGGLNGYTFYTDSIFTSTGVSSDVGFTLTSIVQLLGGALGTLLVDVSGRRSLLLVSEAGMFLGCLATAISFFLQKNNCWETGTPILALISVMVYFGSYGLGMGPLPWMVAAEIYPVDVKGAAGTMCNLASSISSWLVSYYFSFLLQWSSTGTFVIFAIMIGLGFVFTAKFVPETKGKSLEEIQSLLTDSRHEDSRMFGGILGTVLIEVSGRRTLLLVYFGSYGLGMGPLPWMVAAEIYPVDVKGAAGTMCNLSSSISSWLVSYYFSFLLQWSSTGTFVIFAIMIGLGFVFTAKFVPETKGKSLEEIQSLLTDFRHEDSRVF